MNQDYSGRSPASGMGMSVNEAREAATRSSGEVSGRRAPRIDDPGVAMRELPEQMICLEDSVGALYSALEDRKSVV